MDLSKNDFNNKILEEISKRTAKNSKTKTKVLRDYVLKDHIKEIELLLSQGYPIKDVFNALVDQKVIPEIYSYQNFRACFSYLKKQK